MPRRVPFSLLAVLLLTLAVAACDDDGGAPSSLDVRGRVSAAGVPAAGADVYLGRRFDAALRPSPAVIDSTRSDALGHYGFSDLDAGDYAVYAAAPAAGGGYAQVSPFCDDFEVVDKSTAQRDLELVTVAGDGGVTGRIMMMIGDPAEPAAGAEVQLLHFAGPDLVVTATTTSGADGGYAFTDVATGNVVVAATLLLDGESPYPSLLTGESAEMFCDGSGTVMAPDVTVTDLQVDKPALYLYPPQPTDFTVSLGLGGSVRLTASEPAYGDGWRVRVEPSGRIDDRWDYLFYEVGLAAPPQPDHGWCLAGDDLEGGLRRMVASLGLNEAEAGDFLEYWLMRLPPRPFYAARLLLDDAVDPLVRLDIAPAPDVVRRFWIFFSGSDGAVALTAPDIAPIERRGITAVEWGGAVAPSRHIMP
jgi:hypothetical protein